VNCDIVGIVESWATEDIKDAELALDGFTMFRKDRGGERGGGLLLYVSDRFETTLEMQCMNANFEESIWCTVDTAPGSKLLVGLCYRKTNSSSANNESLLEAMEAASKCKIDSHMTIFGDFNYRSINYSQYSVAPDGGLAPQEFFEKTQELFLIRNVHEFTWCREEQRSSVLDYIFTDEENMIDDMKYLAPLGKSDHACLTWCMTVMQTPIDDSTEKLNYWKGDYDSISQDLSNHNWSELLADTQNVDDAWLLFKTELLESISRHVPKRM